MPRRFFPVQHFSQSLSGVTAEGFYGAINSCPRRMPFSCENLRAPLTPSGRQNRCCTFVLLRLASRYEAQEGTPHRYR